MNRFIKLTSERRLYRAAAKNSNYTVDRCSTTPPSIPAHYWILILKQIQPLAESQPRIWCGLLNDLRETQRLSQLLKTRVEKASFKGRVRQVLAIIF